MMTKTVGAVCALMIAMAAPAAANTHEITLVFHDHAMTLVGEFAGYQDDGYLIIYNDQEIHVPAAMVRCEGADCVAADARVASAT